MLDASVLTQRHPVPKDVRDCVVNFATWLRVASNRLGIVLLIIMMKFPICRSEFVRVMKKSAVSETALGIFNAIQEVSVILSQQLRPRYVAEIDEIKAVGLAHGFAILAVKLKVLQPCARGGLTLHTTTYKKLQFGKAAREAISNFLSNDLHRHLANMSAVKSVSCWHEE